jgi:hypothetical protein
MVTIRKSNTASRKPKAIYCDHHYVAAASMNFNLSMAMVSPWKASKDALKQMPMKARMVGSGPKRQISQEERCR